MEPQRDIHARAGASNGADAAGALAAYLGRSCGHVAIDQRIVTQGYRFYAWMSDEIPHFFNKRFTTGTTRLSITLQAGMTSSGDDPFESCASNQEARELLESGTVEQTIWIARMMMGSDTLTIEDVAEPLFLARHPIEFRIIADELVSLGLLQRQNCQVCQTSEE